MGRHGWKSVDMGGVSTQIPCHTPRSGMNDEMTGRSRKDKRRQVDAGLLFAFACGHSKCHER